MSNTDPSKNLTPTLLGVNESDTRRISVIRDEAGYGFTLSRSVIYASDQKNTSTLKNSSSVSQFQTNETSPLSKSSSGSNNQTEVVYVKHVRANGPAFVGGLREGDRPIFINNVSLLDKKYIDIISMIENSGIILDLIVIPSFIQTSGSSTTRTAMPISQPNLKTISSINNTNSIKNSIINSNNSNNNAKTLEPLLLKNTTTTTNTNNTFATSTTATSTTNSNLSTSSSSIINLSASNTNTTSFIASSSVTPSTSITETTSSIPTTTATTPSTPTSPTITSTPPPLLTSSQPQTPPQTPTETFSIALPTLPSKQSQSINSNISEALVSNNNKKSTNNNSSSSSTPVKFEIMTQNSFDLNGITLNNTNLNANDETNSNETTNMTSSTSSAATTSTNATSLASTSPTPILPTNSATTPSNTTNNKQASNINLKNSSGGSIGSGISALLYSLLKNSSTKASTEPPPELSSRRVNRLKNSTFRQQLDRVGQSVSQPPANTNSSSSTNATKATNLNTNSSNNSNSGSVPPLAINESSSLSSTPSSPNTITRNKQDSLLIKNNSNENLNQPNYSNLNKNDINTNISKTNNNIDQAKSISQTGETKRDSPLFPEYKYSYQQYYLENKNDPNNQIYSQPFSNNSIYVQPTYIGVSYSNNTNTNSKHPFYYDTYNRLYEPILVNNNNNYNSANYATLTNNYSHYEDEMNRSHYLNMLYNNYPTPYSSSSSSSYKTRQDDLAALIRRTAELSSRNNNVQINQLSQQQQQQQYLYQYNQPDFYPQNKNHQLNRSSFNNSSIKSNQSGSSTTTGATITMNQPVESLNEIMSSTTSIQKTKTNVKSLDKSSSSPNKESVLLNAVAAAAAAVNKASPQIFSKYIETVHRAMHGHRMTSNEANQKETTLTKQQTNQELKPQSLPPTSLRDNYTTPYEIYTNTDQELIRSRRFVDHCRQIFEQQQQQKLLQQKLVDKQFFTLPSTTQSKLNKQKLAEDYSLNTGVDQPYSGSVQQQTNAKPTSTSLSPVRNMTKSELTNNNQVIVQTNLRASSLGYTNDYQQPSNLTSEMKLNNNKQQRQHDPFKVQHSMAYQRSSSHFNHFNRASYKGECKRMMAKGNMETVVERAARFEDIDIARYNRMKNKLYELELQYQQKEIENQLRLSQQQLEQPILHKSANVNSKLDEKQTEDFVSKLKNLRTVKTNQTTSSDSSIQPNENNKLNASKQQDPTWNKFEPFIAKYYTVGSPPSTSINNSSNNNVKLAASFISNNNSNINNNMLTNFVGDISGSSNNNNSTTNSNNNMSQYYQQQQQFYYLNNKPYNESMNKSPTPYSNSFARRDVLINQQQPPQSYDIDEDDLDPERLYYKRRSITSSPVRYNFNSKSSPPVIMRIDSAKTAKLNRLRSYEQQQLNESNNINTNYEQQVTTPSNLQSWPNNNLRNTSNNYSTIPAAKSLAQYNFLSSTNPANTYIMTSDVGETTSTDSDIGTSPSGTTLASPPSSPQQQLQLQQQQKQLKSNNIQQTSPTNAIIRHHSYLNAVQLNDFKLNNQIKSNNNFATINENEIGLSTTTTTNNQLSDEQKYYYSPSATVQRQQRLLQQKQQQHQQLLQIQNRIKALNEEKLLASLSSSLMARTRSKSSNQMHHQSISLEQDYDEFDTNTTNRMDYSPTSGAQQQLINYRIKPTQAALRHPFAQRSQTLTASTTDENEDNRNNSYMKATTKQQQQLHEDSTASNSTNTKKSSSTTPMQSRNTSIKKLKNFFGEKTPIVLQAVENKNIIASDEFLTTLLDTVKEGVLNCKIVAKDGKRSSDRSWRPAWAVLKKSGALFLCKEKKDNIMIPSVDSYPINLRNSTIDIAYDYNKRKCVFKVVTYNNSEYLFQTADHDSMMEWIRYMQENSCPPPTADLTKITSSTFNDEFNQTRQNWISMENNNNSSNSINEISKSKLIMASSPDEYYLNNTPNNTPNITHNNNTSNLNNNMSPMQPRKSEDTSPRRDNSNRRWVRQMTRRIRDFMTNTNTNEDQMQTHENDQQNDPNENRNFGIPLDKCESSSTSPYVPVVIEVCTRLIELHIIDEGIYRKVGQKQVVNALRAQLNRGILNIDISDYNWDNPHAVVSLLKCFLNELPDSLTTSQFYNEFIQMCRIEHHHIRLIAIKKLLRKLSIYNYETLRYLSAHLRRVAAAHQHNKMTIKNLCIAFSQSLIRLNEANCETIKTDHVSQSLLIELILIYHDWLFDSNQIDNVPDQVKDIVENQLFQQYCTYIEPIAYTDLLLNIMKSIRQRWYSTNSSITSSTSNTITAGFGNKSLVNSSSNEHDFTNSKQAIQFRSNKKEIFRSAKSASVLNSSQTKNEKQKQSKKQQQIQLEKEEQQTDENTNAQETFNSKHVRSRSVDVRFKTIGMLLASSSNNNNSGGGLLSKQSKSKSKEDKFKSALKYKTEGFTKQKQRLNLTQELISNSKFRKLNQSTNRKSYGDLIKSTLFEDYHLDETPSSNTTPIIETKTKNDELKINSTNDMTNLNERLDEQFINFKLLEKKSEQEREKLSNLMKKLEIDLMNAKMDLMEDEYVKSTPINMLYPNLCITSPTNSNKLKPLPSQIYNNNINTSSLSSSSSVAVNKPVQNKYLLSSSYSSSTSTSSGIVATTGPSSSSSSSVSTSPPLDMQQKFSKTVEKENSQISRAITNESKTDSKHESKNTRLLLINRPRKLPKRRHTIGSSYDSVMANKCENYSSMSSSSSYLSSGDDNFNLKQTDLDNDADDDEKFDILNSQRRKKLNNSSNKENLDDTLTKIIASKSINYLPSLSYFRENILYPGPLETKNITKRRTNSKAKKSLNNTLNSTGNTTNHNNTNPSLNKKVILNLSSLSMSASSISSSSSSESLNKSKNQAKVDDLNRLSKNYDDCEAIKLDNFIKQNIKFNCTFESLI